MRIQFAETNLLAEIVGEADGVSRAEIQSCRSIAADPLHAFQKRSESKDVGFPHLPFQTELIESVRKYAG